MTIYLYTLLGALLAHAGGAIRRESSYQGARGQVQVSGEDITLGFHNSSANQGVDGPTCRNELTLLTWNVENLGRKSWASKRSAINKQLQKMISGGVGIVFLQEVESCKEIMSAIEASNWTCVGSPVPEDVEARTDVVLGGVILFKPDYFAASNMNRVTNTSWAKNMSNFVDSTGLSLADHHHKECTWEAMHGCSNPHPDVPKTTTVRLKLMPDMWCPELIKLFPEGLRAVNVHLFSGARMFADSPRDKADEMRAGRRAFQMRAHFWMTHLWNNISATDPTTIYAGDFNTRGKTELQSVVAAAPEYGVHPWCPASGGLCSKAEATMKTHKAGYLDNVVIDVRPETVRTSMRANATVISDFGGCSDHAPLVVRISAPVAAPVTRAVTRAANGKKPFW